MSLPTVTEAARNLLDALTDDHDDCLICGSHEGEAHDPETPCGELESVLLEDAGGACVHGTRNGTPCTRCGRIESARRGAP